MDESHGLGSGVRALLDSARQPRKQRGAWRLARTPHRRSQAEGQKGVVMGLFYPQDYEQEVDIRPDSDHWHAYLLFENGTVLYIYSEWSYDFKSPPWRTVSQDEFRYEGDPALFEQAMQ